MTTVPGWVGIIRYGEIVICFIAIGIGVFRWRSLDRFRHLLVWWLGVDFVFSVLEQLTRKYLQNGHITAIFWYPFSGVVACWVVAAIPQPAGRVAAFRIAAMVYFAAWTVAMLTVETPGEPAQVVGALHGLTLLALGALSMARRSVMGRVTLWRDPIFLFSAGMIVYATPIGLLSRLNRYLAPHDPVALSIYYAIRNAIGHVGLIIMAAALTIGYAASRGRRTVESTA